MGRLLRRGFFCSFHPAEELEEVQMDQALEAWMNHAEEHQRSAIVGVSLGGPEMHLVYNRFDDLSDQDFEDIVSMLFVLFSGRPGRSVVDRLEMMDAAYRQARVSVTLECMESAGEA